MPRRADVMLSSEHAETQQGGVLDGIDHYQLPQSTVTKIAKATVSFPCSPYRAPIVEDCLLSVGLRLWYRTNKLANLGDSDQKKLPPNAKLQKESVLALVKGSTVFINYIAAAAQEVANARGHKTIVASDVLQALELAEFGDMVPSLNKDLAEYRARLKKAPQATTKKEPATSTKDPKGKGRVSSGKTEASGEETTKKVSNGKQVASAASADEAIEGGDEDEEPYSEPDIPDDELEAEEQEEEQEEAEAGTMDVDNEDGEPARGTQRLDENDSDSE
ncbi:hypothetical protein FRC17_010582 [Serendipita sp. 399]|nr:hypothetical protein FRC17_010582 [Serendipita sp. 399]